MKLRLLAMGSIIALLGVALAVTRGFTVVYLGLAAVGIVLLASGAVWK